MTRMEDIKVNGKPLAYCGRSVLLQEIMRLHRENKVLRKALEKTESPKDDDLKEKLQGMLDKNK